MTNDLISQAEALIEKHDTSGYIHRDATLLLPGLVEEIKRLDKRETKTLQRFNNLLERCRHAEEELAKWQQIAIEERARRNVATHCIALVISPDAIMGTMQMIDGMDITPFLPIAAKELGLQGYKTAYEPNGPIEINGEKYVKAAYIERLETDYLSWVREYYRDLGEEEAIARAHAALEKIRRG